MRADVNVSVRKAATKEWGTRCEIKNVNSIRFIGEAVEAEARRQIGIIEDGGTIEQETRLYDSVKRATRSMRSKEEAHDYRYFPDPDLLPLELDPAWVKAIEATLPELPDAKKARFQSQYGLSAYDAGVLISDQAKADFYETAAKGRDAKLTANWVTNDLAARLSATHQEFSESPIAASALAELVQLIAANPGQAAAVKEKPQAIGWFVGQVMKATAGKANPTTINQLLRAKLGG